MDVYTATVRWERGGDDFASGRYSRGHVWSFDGGAEVPGSSSPHSVRVPYSVEENVDPEEAFVASLSSCHMLFFLHFAQKAGYVVNAYTDEAEGVMEKNEDGRMAVTRVTLRPVVHYEGVAPDRAEEEELHHKSHDACFIANSVKSEIRVKLPD